MNRDTEELPVIMKELEDNAEAIDVYRYAPSLLFRVAYRLTSLSVTN